MYEYSSQNNEVLILNKHQKQANLENQISGKKYFLRDNCCSESLQDDWTNSIGTVADSNIAFSVKNNLLKRAM